MDMGKAEMKNYFEEMKEKGIVEVELSVKELHDLFMEDRITAEQFNICYIQMFGEEAFQKLMKESLEHAYSINLLREKDGN